MLQRTLDNAIYWIQVGILAVAVFAGVLIGVLICKL